MAVRVVASLLCLSVFLLAGCASSSPEGAVVGIHGSAYDPASVTVDKGDHVHFENHDSFKHSITADTGGAFDADVEGGAEANVEFPNAGTFAYHCKYHPSMHGTVIVS